MIAEVKVEAILFRIALIKSKILIVEDIYEQNLQNNRLLDVKTKFQDLINILEQHLQQILDEADDFIDIENIKKRVKVINKDPLLDFEIQSALSNGSFIDTEVEEHKLPTQVVLPENQRFSIVQ
jgi:hypothetical protein